MRDVLLTAMDRVHAAIADRRGPDVIAALLDDLARLSAEHFATEERVLRRYGYTHLDARSARHTRLLDQAAALQQRLRSGERKGPHVSRFLHSLSRQAGYQDRPAA